MIRKMINGLEKVEVYFLFKDCKKLIKKYYGKKAEELGKQYSRDAIRMMKKYRHPEVCRNMLLDTIYLIESYDYEAYKAKYKEIFDLIQEVKSAPDSAGTPSQGNETH